MDYPTALEKLSTLGRFGIRLGLERMAFLLERLGHPERRCAAVHVGGTNGKGSVAAMLAAALQAAGYRTALYTSPHLVSYTERFRLDGADMAPGEFAACLARCWPLVEAAEAAGVDPPTEFELLTAMAYVWAAEAGADVLVQEVGLGGRLDSTNLVARPAITVLTNVALDHTDKLGDTIEAIAREKVGIVKPGAPVVSGFTGVARRVLEERGAAIANGDAVTSVDGYADAGAPPLHHLDDLATWRVTIDWDDDTGAALPLLDYRGLEWHVTGAPLALAGSHQGRNAALALLALEVLHAAGDAPGARHLQVPRDAALRGLASARWPGRMELCVPSDAHLPRVLLDGAHNPAAAAAFADALPRNFRWRRLHAVLGMFADKDVEAALPLLARHSDRVFLTPLPGARSAPVERLARALRGATLPPTAVAPGPHAGSGGSARIIACSDPAAAFAAAQDGLDRRDLVVVAGSLSLVGAIRPLATGAHQGGRT